MAKPRDYKREARRADERAQAKGYKNAYDYRIHEYGQIPPNRPPIPKGMRSYVRGHRSYFELLKRVKSDEGRGAIWALTPTRRNAKGQIIGGRVDLQLRSGRQEHYSVSGKHLKRIKGDLARRDEPTRQQFSGGMSQRGADFFDGLPPAAQDAFIDAAGGDPLHYSDSELAYIDGLDDPEAFVYDEADLYDWWGELMDALDDADILIADPYTGEL